MNPLRDPNRIGYAAAFKGDRAEARLILVSRIKSRNAETFRARWDGAAALLNWWHALEPSGRPPLDCLRDEDAQAFIRSLEDRGLARSTIRSYRVGASDLTKAIRKTRDSRDIFPAYNPFRDARLKPAVRKVPAVDREELAAMADVQAHAKLTALLSLLELGITIPEACTRYWSDVSLEQRKLTGYDRRQVTLSAEAIEALTALWKVAPKPAQSRNRRIFRWSADTARRWLKLVRIS